MLLDILGPLEGGSSQRGFFFTLGFSLVSLIITIWEGKGLNYVTNVFSWWVRLRAMKPGFMYSLS